MEYIHNKELGRKYLELVCTTYSINPEDKEDPRLQRHKDIQYMIERSPHKLSRLFEKNKSLPVDTLPANYQLREPTMKLVELLLSKEYSVLISSANAYANRRQQQITRAHDIAAFVREEMSQTIYSPTKPLSCPGGSTEDLNLEDAIEHTVSFGALEDGIRHLEK